MLQVDSNRLKTKRIASVGHLDAEHVSSLGKRESPEDHGDPSGVRHSKRRKSSPSSSPATTHSDPRAMERAKQNPAVSSRGFACAARLGRRARQADSPSEQHSFGKEDGSQKGQTPENSSSPLPRSTSASPKQATAPLKPNERPTTRASCSQPIPAAEQRSTRSSSRGDTAKRARGSTATVAAAEAQIQAGKLVGCSQLLADPVGKTHESSSGDEKCITVPLRLHPHSQQLADLMLTDSDAEQALQGVQGPSIAGLRAAASISDPAQLPFLPQACELGYFLAAELPEEAGDAISSAGLPEAVLGLSPLQDVSESDGEGLDISITQMPSIAHFLKPTSPDALPAAPDISVLGAAAADLEQLQPSPVARAGETPESTRRGIGGCDKTALSLSSGKPLSPMDDGPTRNPNYLVTSEGEEGEPSQPPTAILNLPQPSAHHPSANCHSQAPIDASAQPLPQSFPVVELRTASDQLEELRSIAATLRHQGRDTNPAVALPLLQYLVHRPATPLLLIQSQIALAVRSFRKHGEKRVADTACRVIACWRALMGDAAAAAASCVAESFPAQIQAVIDAAE